MLEGAFDVGLPGMFWVSLTVFFLCFSLRLLGTVVVAYGPRRMGLVRPKWVTRIRQPKAGWRGYIWWVLLGMPIIVLCLFVSAKGTLPGVREGWVTHAPLNPPQAAEVVDSTLHWGRVTWLGVAAALGLVAALVVFVFLLWLHRRGVEHSAEAQAGDMSLYADPMIPKWLARLFARAAEAKPWPWLNWLPVKLGSLITWLFGRQGYYHPGTRRLRSGHRLSILMAVALLILYWVIYALPVLPPPWTIAVPVLVYLTMLVLVVVWWLHAIAFALDRYRIPVALPLLVIILFSQFAPWTQYRFTSINDGRKLDPVAEEAAVATAVELLSEDPSGCPVVVAAEGGGIHSGAWATHVLRLLEKNYRAEGFTTGPEVSFSKHIVCVSGVSGGSYGLMYWVDSYGRNGGPASLDYDEGVTWRLTEDRAMRSSLAASIRGLVYHDVWQTFMPIPIWQPGQDRGSLMEREWVKPPRDMEYPQPLVERTMKDWRRDAKAGLRPAVLFNSMNADNGQPVVFGSTSLGRKEDKPYWEYRRQRPGEDVPVVAAVRCSASFPFVCPAASPSSDRLGSMHLVDGGYFDNYGMASLNRWLGWAADTWERAAKSKTPAPSIPKRLLVVQVRASSQSLFPQILEPSWSGKGRTGFLYQAEAPILGLVNMRGAAQTWHNDQEYDNLVRRLEALNIKVRTAVFRYPNMANPLSWHLTKSQKQAIQNVTFEPPKGDVRNQRDRTVAPTAAGEQELWDNWTRHVAQWSLHEAWRQVVEHFKSVPNRSQATPGADAKGNSNTP